MVTDVNVVTLSYLASLMESEGCISILKYKQSNSKLDYELRQDCYVMQFSVTNNDPMLMEWLQNTFGGSVVYIKEASRKSRIFRPSMLWRLRCQDIFELGTILGPYMFIKKRELEIMVKMRLTYINSKRGRGHNTDPELIVQRDKYYREFREVYERRVNHKGKRHER